MVNSVELMQLCRLCLVKEQVNIPIFNNESDVQQIFLKISTCLPVKVAREDNLPKKICSDCSYKLDVCYQFWNTSATSEKQLLTWLNEVGLNQEALKDSELHKPETNPPNLVLKQEAIEPESEIIHDVANDVSAESQEYILQQQQLPYQTSSFPFTDNNFGQDKNSVEPSNSKAAKKRETPLKRKRQAAPATITQPNTDDDMEEDVDDPTETKVAKTEETSDDDHEDDDDGMNDDESNDFPGVPSTSTDNEQPGPSGVGKNVVDAPFEEQFFKSSILSLEDVKEYHFLNESNQNTTASDSRIKCNICGQLSTDRSEAVTHMKEYHEKFDARVCYRCNLVFEDRKVYQRHSRKDHPMVKLFSCSICDRHFKFLSEMKTHMKIHDVRDVRKCSVCDRTFLTENGLKVHVESHLNDHPVECDVCGKTMKKSHLSLHKKNVHENPNEYQCESCPKSFRSLSSWKIHCKTHIPDYKPPSFECEKCGKKLTHERSILKHIKHGCEKKYVVCELCGKSIVLGDNFRRHMNIHNKKKPHICEICGKSFAARTTLKDHKVVHTKEKPHACTFCDKKFTQSHSLKHHLRKVHNNEKS